MREILRRRIPRLISASPLTARAAPGASAALGLMLASFAAHAQAATLGASDFTVTLSQIDSSNTSHALTADQLTDLLPAVRCSCPVNLGAAVAINSASAANVSASDMFTASLLIGSNCDNTNVTTCVSIGADLMLGASTTSGMQTFSSSEVFTAVTAATGTTCSTLTGLSTRVWAIIRQNGALLASQPSVSVSVGGAGPSPPTAVQATTADSGLLVSWTPPSTITSLQGYQVLCSPAASTASSPAFDSCTAGLLAAGTAPFATLDSKLVCSGLVSVGTNQVRVKNLQNGTAYQVAVVSINADGTPSAISDAATATPQPTLGFDDLYKQEGGTGLVACAAGGAPARGGGPATAVLCALAVAIAARRRRGRGARPRVTRGGRARRTRWWRVALRSALGLVLALAAARAARAGEVEDPDRITHGYRVGEEPETSAWSPSPRNWNLELRFGPYYPGVDSEFADRGSTARPFEQTFTSKQRLMYGLELDRQILHRGGTWALGFSFAVYRANANSLAGDLMTRTGDETSLTFYPLALQAVYRADFLHERYGSPVVPFAKLGLDCAIWSVSNSGSGSSTRGRTLGWDAAAGIALDLSFIDAEGMRSMDSETGVNGISLFGEVTHLGLDGFGSSSVLRLGDTTWVAGLMMEM